MGRVASEQDGCGVEWAGEREGCAGVVGIRGEDGGERRGSPRGAGTGAVVSVRPAPTCACGVPCPARGLWSG